MGLGGLTPLRRIRMSYKKTVATILLVISGFTMTLAFGWIGTIGVGLAIISFDMYK